MGVRRDRGTLACGRGARFGPLRAAQRRAELRVSYGDVLACLAAAASALEWTTRRFLGFLAARWTQKRHDRSTRSRAGHVCRELRRIPADRVTSTPDPLHPARRGTTAVAFRRGASAPHSPGKYRPGCWIGAQACGRL